MAIGSVSSPTGYTIGGKPLGVQLGSSTKATDLFGEGNADVSNLFSASVAATSGLTVDTKDIVVKALQDQIDRLQGYRTNLTPAEKQDLTEYQDTITNINEIATGRLLTDDEIQERAEAYIEAYKILGKEYQDFSSDDFITEKSQELEDLLATKPTGAEATRLERLQTTYDNLMDSATNRDTDPPATLVAQISSIYKQISQLTAARPMASLTPDEIRQHDALVEEINDHAGFEVELNSTKKAQIERLQDTIDQIENGTTAGLFA